MTTKLCLPLIFAPLLGSPAEYSIKFSPVGIGSERSAEADTRPIASCTKCKRVLENMLSSSQIQAFKALRVFLDESATVLRHSPEQKTLSFTCKPGVKVAETKKYITGLVRSIANKSGTIPRPAFEATMAGLKQCDLSGLDISSGEITLHYHKLS